MATPAYENQVYAAPAAHHDPRAESAVGPIMSPPRETRSKSIRCLRRTILISAPYALRYKDAIGRLGQKLRPPRSRPQPLRIIDRIVLRPPQTDRPRPPPSRTSKQNVALACRAACSRLANRANEEATQNALTFTKDRPGRKDGKCLGLYHAATCPPRQHTFISRFQRNARAASCRSGCQD